VDRIKGGRTGVTEKINHRIRENLSMGTDKIVPEVISYGRKWRKNGLRPNLGYFVLKE